MIETTQVLALISLAACGAATSAPSASTADTAGTNANGAGTAAADESGPACVPPLTIPNYPSYTLTCDFEASTMNDLPAIICGGYSKSHYESPDELEPLGSNGDYHDLDAEISASFVSKSNYVENDVLLGIPGIQQKLPDKTFRVQGGVAYLPLSWNGKWSTTQGYVYITTNYAKDLPTKMCDSN